ncbi:hypothetical protein RQP46_011127 [Phenoliferia psychrophenolica]
MISSPANLFLSPPSGEFVQRFGPRLVLDGNDFKAVGPNIYWLGLDENVVPNPSWPSRNRVLEVMATAAVMGATTVRSTTLGVSVGSSLSVQPSLNVTNEAAFAAIDWAVWAAKSYGLRLILPLTDQYDYYHGGIPTFLRFRGLSAKSPADYGPFYNTTGEVFEDFKDYIKTLVTHQSNITGLSLAEEPTVLAFELGNELGGWGLNSYPPPIDWVNQTAAYVKSLAPNTLVLSGTYGVREDELHLTDVDIFSNHFYPPYSDVLRGDAARASSFQKAFLVGEFDWTDKYYFPLTYLAIIAPVVIAAIIAVLPIRWFPWRISLGCCLRRNRARRQRAAVLPINDEATPVLAKKESLNYPPAPAPHTAPPTPGPTPSPSLNDLRSLPPSETAEPEPAPATATPRVPLLDRSFLFRRWHLAFIILMFAPIIAGIIHAYLPSPLKSFLSTMEHLSGGSRHRVSGSFYWSLLGRNDTCCSYVQHDDGYTLHYPTTPGAVSHDVEGVFASASAAPSFTLTTTNFNRTAFQVQPYVSNGYIGQRIPVEGFGYQEVVPNNATAMDGTNGWPLFDTRFTAAMVAGFYDSQENTTGTNFPQTGGEQPISTLPTWSSLYLTINGETYDVSTPTSEISNWTQSMSIEDGVVQTRLAWTPAGSASPLNLLYTIFAHRTLPNLGVVRLDVEGLVQGQNVSVTDVLDGMGSWRTTPVAAGIVSNYSNTIFSAVAPNGISNVTAYETSLAVLYPFSSTVTTSPSCYSNLSTSPSTASQCYTISVPTNGKISAIKYVGIASSDAFAGVEFTTALHASRHGNFTGYTDILAQHREGWSALWEESDIIIPGDDELQLATRASLFHMLANVREGDEGHGIGDNSIAPAGLTSDSYAGQDADLWMYPSLLALFPSYAENINNFRTRQHGAAIENAKQYNSSGALYPWMGARFGNCTGVGPCYDYEYHLNNDIALAQFQYYAATANLTWLETKGWPIIQTVAEFWAGHVIYNATTLKYDTLNETDPDEYANHIDNAAFTNAGISVVFNTAIALAVDLNITVPSNWSDIADKITILYDPTSNIVVEYDGFTGTTDVKQADVVLLTYPLEFPQTATQSLVDLDFYALATSPSGPGMTYSIFSIDSSTLSSVGCASYTYMLASSQPYNRAPFYQFSEQTTDAYTTNGGTNPAFTFLTGHGGFLQSFTHGFTGYRSRTTALYLDPILPSQLTNYTIKGFKWQGSTFDLTLTTNTTTITRRTGGDGNATVEVAPRNAMAGNYTLAVGASLTIPTSRTNGALVEGNLAQCASTLGSDTTFASTNTGLIVPGQYALGAIDGSNATVWQPFSNSSTTMTVDLGAEHVVRALHFNWGENPPLFYSVTGGPSLSNQSTLAMGNVSISAAFNAATANDVVVRIGNLTDVTLDASIGGGGGVRFVNLTVVGSFLGDGRGGTVAEFAVL